MYAYLIGTGMLGIIWLILFLRRKDLRHAMLWSASFYIVMLSIGFLLLYLVNIDPSMRINPGYWTPPTLFDLNNKTGGYSIEDALFMFFMAGIAAATYEVLTNRRILKTSDRRLKKRHALWIGLLGSVIICSVFNLNSMYLLIFFNLFGGLAIIYQRPDLLKQAVLSALILMIIYWMLFTIFNLLFPDFISTYDHLQHTTKLIILGIPLEEYLYALTFGFIWAPIYEYEHQVRDRRIGNKSKTKGKSVKKKTIIPGFNARPARVRAR